MSVLHRGPVTSRPRESRQIAGRLPSRGDPLDVQRRSSGPAASVLVSYVFYFLILFQMKKPPTLPPPNDNAATLSEELLQTVADHKYVPLLINLLSLPTTATTPYGSSD